MEVDTELEATIHGAIIPIPKEEIDVYWDTIEEHLLYYPDTWRFRLTLSSIKEQLKDGRLQFWVLIKDRQRRLSFITQANVFPGGKCLTILWAAGFELEFIVESLEGFMAYFAELGFQWMEVQGREGWKKPLKELGFKTVQVAYRKDLTSARMEWN